MTTASKVIHSMAAASRLLPGVQGRGRVGLLLGHRYSSQVSVDFDFRMRMGHQMVVPASSSQSWRAAFRIQAHRLHRQGHLEFAAHRLPD